MMKKPARLTEFEARLVETLEATKLEMVGWVVLPNHYHALVLVDRLEYVAAAAKQLHGFTSRLWNIEDGSRGRKVWFKYEDRRIRSERHHFAALNYIHYNPVKHKHVASPLDWPWSSAHVYLKDMGRGWLRDKWKKFPILEMGKGWDD
ncbi:MAG: transposase [Planctomycetota bacterium]|nr:transposase [Planctomycetota bacterium]